MKSRQRTKPLKPGRFYRQLWRILDGNVYEVFHKHPKYLRPTARESDVRRSINKRVVGALLAYVEQSTKRRSGS